MTQRRLYYTARNNTALKVPDQPIYIKLSTSPLTD